MYIKSIYTYHFERDGKYYLYNSQSGLFCEISQATYSVLYDREYSCMDKSTLDYLIEKCVIINEDEKYLYYDMCKSKWLMRRYNDATLGLVIAPTVQCNFDCPYCFESKIENGIMTDEVENSLVEFIKIRENTKTINLTWYGGEPLLAFERIKSIWHRLTEEFPDVKVVNQSIVTNGWLLNNEVFRFFSSTNLGHMQITLDGVEENHNRTRCLKNGNPTFDVIYANIIKATKELPNTKISVRVNVNRNNSRDYAIIARRLEKEGCNNLSVYPGFIREDTTDGLSLKYSSYTGCGCHSFYVDLKSEGLKIKFFPREQIGKGCMINSMHSCLIGPKGEIYKCWNDVGHTDRVVGNIADNKKSNHVRLTRYMNETSVFSDDKCKDCHVFPICDGGCGYYRYRNKFENGAFNLCTRYKDNKVLEDSLLQSIENNK